MYIVHSGCHGMVSETCGQCLVIQRHFYAVYGYLGKPDLGKDCWNPNRKLGETIHFSEEIKEVLSQRFCCMLCKTAQIFEKEPFL